MSLTKHDVAHLKEGMEVTVTLRRIDNNRPTNPVSGTLELASGNLRIGTSTVVDRNGNPGIELLGVISPKPPASPKWTVGQRLTDGTDFAILTANSDNSPWQVYTRDYYLSWLSHEDVDGWTPVVDEPALILDERVEEIICKLNTYESTYTRPNSMWDEVLESIDEIDLHPYTDTLILSDKTVLQYGVVNKWCIHYRPNETP